MLSERLLDGGRTHPWAPPSVSEAASNLPGCPVPLGPHCLAAALGGAPWGDSLGGGDLRGPRDGLEVGAAPSTQLGMGDSGSEGSGDLGPGPGTFQGGRWL